MTDDHAGAGGRQHSDVTPELRQLAQAILDRLDPVVRLAAARAQGVGDVPGRCQQLWCPICALAAMVSGEQHPLLSVIAEHSVALLVLVRALVDDLDGGGKDGGGGGDDGGGGGGGDHPDPGPGRRPPQGPHPDGPAGSSPGDPPPSGPGRYEHIPVFVEE